MALARLASGLQRIVILLITMAFICCRMPYKGPVTTIQITPPTREKLRDLGKKGGTYEQIILRRVKAYNKKR